MKRRSKKARTARELDLMDLLAHCKRTDERVTDALVTVLCRADASTLAALGVVFKLVAAQTDGGADEGTPPCARSGGPAGSRG